MNTTIQLLKILVAEDDENDYKILYDYLNNISSWKFDIKRVHQYEDAADELNNNSFILCFCNTELDNRKGVDLLSDSSFQTPVIFLSSNNDHKAEMLAIEAGAFDFLAKKGLNNEKLERSISYAVERRNQLKKLHESERKYNTFFQKFHDIVFITDENFRLVNINYAVKEMLGFDEEKCEGRSILDFFNNPADASVFMTTLKADGEIQNFEAPLLTVDDNLVVCSISASVESDGLNQNYIQGTIKDISKTKQVEKAYLQSEKHAASGRFIFTLAHELRNPLNNIKLAVENLLPGLTNEEDAFFLNIVQRNGERINDLVTELLNSSKPAEIKCEDLLLHELLNRVTDGLQAKLEQRDIELSTHYDVVNATIKADPEKLETAISNIIENAMEAVDEGKGHIELTTVYHNNQLTLLIKDNGPGISDDHKDRLFEPFFTSKRNGIGLGLATALNILQSHHAKTEVHSTEDKGTTFSIHFAV